MEFCARGKTIEQVEGRGCNYPGQQGSVFLGGGCTQTITPSPLAWMSLMCAMRTYMYSICLTYCACNLCKLFYTSYSVFTIIFTIACPTVAIKSPFSIRHFAVDTCTHKRPYF